ncbi:unnamed protein product [Ostreobium quekettii]|uniref:Uncharacterized protein n=1 Tax=Ostreobium quekettii TaxID=121088 RepID=A0A8S1J5E1_9CHLO|nr:unnamed protein product [Ostreobium quekettii]
MLVDPLGRHFQKRVWPHCLAWVRFKKWRPASVDPADHSRYDAYLKRWRRKNARRELEETLRREDDREAGKHAQGGGSMEFFHDSFVEDDESDQRLGTFQRHRQSAKQSQMRWAGPKAPSAEDCFLNKRANLSCLELVLLSNGFCETFFFHSAEIGAGIRVQRECNTDRVADRLAAGGQSVEE